MGRTIHTYRSALICAVLATGSSALAVEPQPRVGAELAASHNAESSPRNSLSRAMALLEAKDAEAALKIVHDRKSELSKADEFYVRGRARFIQGKLSAARRDLQSAIKTRKKHADSHYWLARVYQSDGAHALACTGFQTAYALGLGTCDLHLHWAESLRACDEVMGEVRQQNWTEDRTSAPRSGHFDFDGLVIGVVRGQPEIVLIAPRKSALYQVHKAIEADADRGDAMLLAGELWAAIDRHESAAIMFKRAAARVRGDALSSCHRNWAASSLALGRHDSYLDHTKTQMQLGGGIDNEELARSYERAAVDASNRGNLRKQTRYLTLAAETRATPGRYIELADALLLAQRAEDAERYLKLALDMNPSKQQRAEIKLRLLRTAYLATPDAGR